MLRRSGSRGVTLSVAVPARALRQACIGFALSLLTVGPAAALDCAAVILDKSDQFSFGQAPLGAKRSQLPADAAAPRQCEETCEYVDNAGVKYVVKSEQIIAKEIPDVSRYRGTMPVHIAAADSLLTVLKRLAAFTESAPIWSLTVVPGGGLLLHTDNCIENSDGVRGSYGFTFDREGRLGAISAEVL